MRNTMPTLNPAYTQLAESHAAVVDAMRTLTQRITEATDPAVVSTLAAAHATLYATSTSLFRAAWATPTLR